MKIDFIIQSLNGGGAERVMATLANEMIKNHQIRIITFNQTNDDPFELDNKIQRVNLNKESFKNKTIQAIFNLSKFYKEKSNQPNLMISFIHSNNLIAIIAGKLKKIKVIACEHTNHQVVTSKKVKWTREYLYKYANATTVLTKFDFNYYKKHGANVVVMPNPIEFPSKNVEFSNRSPFILAIGDLNRYSGKGFDNLIKIVEPILKKNKEWKLKIAGGGNEGLIILKKLVKTLNLENSVEFPGFCRDVNAIMDDSQIFVLPSKYEGLPMGLMEALSNGMACIAYNCPSGPEDLIKNNENGFLVENQNFDLMQSGINDLVNSYPLREKIASKAQSSMKPFRLKEIINKWEHLFESLEISNE